MKVVLAFDMGEEYVEELRSSFPEVDFRIAYAVEEQVREVVDAEVQFGLITRPVFWRLKNSSGFISSASASTQWCAKYRSSRRVGSR